MAKVLTNKAEFQTNVLDAKAPVVVDFFAQWCGPCKMIAPVIDEISQELEGKAVVVKVDSDEAPDVCAEYGIRLLPTLVFFKDGKKVDEIVGMADKEVIVEKLNSLM